MMFLEDKDLYDSEKQVMLWNCFKHYYYISNNKQQRVLKGI